MGLATAVRNIELLAQCPPAICLKLTETAIGTRLPKFRDAKVNRLVQLGTAVLSYEPVLQQLKKIKRLPIEEELLHWKAGQPLLEASHKLSSALEDTLNKLEKQHCMDLKRVLEFPKPVRLDKCQAECFLAGLRQRLTLIQGPPGTGKSFIGALIAKAVDKFSLQKVLVVCYTNHALDQFLEDRLDAGIPPHEMVRLGSIKKTTPRTLPLSIHRLQARPLSKIDPKRMKSLKAGLKVEGEKLGSAFDSFREATVTKRDIVKHLKKLKDGPPFRKALLMSDEGGKDMNEDYLLNQWYRGKGAGI